MERDVLCWGLLPSGPTTASGIGLGLGRAYGRSEVARPLRLPPLASPKRDVIQPGARGLKLG
jgi:hypothetical protein